MIQTRFGAVSTDFFGSAWRRLKGSWLIAAAVTFVYLFFQNLVGTVSQKAFEMNMALGPLLGLLILVVGCLLLLLLFYGYEVMFLKKSRAEGKIGFSGLFQGFSGYGRILGTLLLEALYLVLWFLLFIIPCVVKSLSYSMTSYILLDEPDLRYNAAIEKSMAIMKGHKWEWFFLTLVLSFVCFCWVMLLSFVIYMLFLSLVMSGAFIVKLLFAIAIIIVFAFFFFTLPYAIMVKAEFYKYVKAEYEGRLKAEGEDREKAEGIGKILCSLASSKTE